MTGGTVVVLGETGRNFGAGMTGGSAYVLDEQGTFERRLNPALVTLSRVSDPGDAQALRDLVTAHREATGSAPAREILEDWARWLPRFWKVVPRAVPAAAAVSPGTGDRRRRRA
jgi:glutamate synthase domain-containing protein 3